MKSPFQTPVSLNKRGPIIPPGSFLDAKGPSRARVRVAVFVVLSVHALGLVALLMQGCNRPPTQNVAEQMITPQVPPKFETPASAPATPDTTSPVVQPKPQPVVERSVVSPPPTPVVTQNPPAVATQTYKVAKGDTLRSIGSKFHVAVPALVKANPGVQPTRLKIGQTILIPVSGPATITASSTR